MDPAFRRASVYFDDIEYQRRFEQNLIRFGLVSGKKVTEEINTVINSAVTVGGGGGGPCNWTKEGTNLVYYEGNVGVGVHPHDNDFEVRGNVLVEAVAEQPYLEIRNWSDVAYDPVVLFSVGATPVTKWAIGVDDSAGDAFVIAAGGVLGTGNVLSLSTTAVSTPVQIISSLAVGTAPFSPTSTTVCGNLNADMVDGYHHNQSLLILASPTFVGLTLSGLTASHPVFTDAGNVLVSTGTVPVDHGGTGIAVYAIGDLIYASGTTTLALLADVAVASYLRSGGVGAAPLWSTLKLPNAATAYRLPVATSANTIGEVAAVGATGEYLAGVTGAIPVWATLNQAAVAGLTIADSPNFAGLSVGTNDVARGLLYLYGHETGGAFGGTLLCYTSADHDTVIANYGFMVKEDDLLIGPDTNVDALLLDSNDDLYVTAGSIILPASEYLNFGGVLGAGSYGMRDNAGTIELKNSGGAWASPLSSVTAHNVLSATHGDTTVASVVRGDIVTGQGASPNTKWARFALGGTGTYLAGSATEPSWATLNQAAVAGLTTASSPEFVTVKCSGLTDGYVPYHVADATGLANSPIYSDGTNVGFSLTTLKARFDLGVAAGVTYPGYPILRFTDIGVPTYGFTFQQESSATGDLSICRILADVASPILTFQRATGYIGVGMEVPARPIDMAKTGGGINAPIYRWQKNNTDYAEQRNWGISTEHYTTGDFNLFESSTNTGDPLSGTARLTVKSGGNVGIADTNPAEALDVTGNINVTGVYKVDDVQVLKEQQAAIANLNAAYIAGELDTEAEIITAINATNAKINAILAMHRTHGIIAT